MPINIVIGTDTVSNSAQHRLLCSGASATSTQVFAENPQLTTDRVPYVDANGLLKDSSSLTYDGAKLSVTGDVATGEAVLKSETTGNDHEWAIWAKAGTSSVTPAEKIGVYGETDNGIAGVFISASTTSQYAGLVGVCTGATGNVHGVKGETQSSNNDAYGGWFTSLSGGSWADLTEQSSSPATPPADNGRIWVQQQSSGGSGNNSLHFIDEKGIDRGLAGIVPAGYAGGSDTSPGTGTPASYSGATIDAVSTVLGKFTGTNQTYTFPASSLHAGKVIRLRGWGVYSTASSGGGSLRLGAMLSHGASSTCSFLCQSAAITPNAGVTNAQWRFEADCLVVGDGASGKLEVQGMALLSTGSTGSGLQCWPMSNTTEVGSFDLTTANVLLLSAQWGASPTADALTLRLLTVEILN